MSVGGDGVALVVGASGAFGAAVSRLLDRRGYRVALHYTTGKERAGKVAAELSRPGTLVQADIADWDSTKAMVDEVAGRLGAVSVLVNSGAVRRDGLMATQSVDDWSRTMNVNLLGTFHACRAVLPAMLRGRWGRIVNVVSPAGLIGSRGQTAYSASKAGVIGMTRSLALECGRRKVTVNALSPGLMASELTSGVPEDVRDGLVARTAFGRAAAPEEIACGMELLLDADYMTGQVLSIDGGISV